MNKILIIILLVILVGILFIKENNLSFPYMLVKKNEGKIKSTRSTSSKSYDELKDTISQVDLGSLEDHKSIDDLDTDCSELASNDSFFN